MFAKRDRGVLEAGPGPSETGTGGPGGPRSGTGGSSTRDRGVSESGTGEPSATRNMVKQTRGGGGRRGSGGRNWGGRHEHKNQSDARGPPNRPGDSGDKRPRGSRDTPLGPRHVGARTRRSRSRGKISEIFTPQTQIHTDGAERFYSPSAAVVVGRSASAAASRRSSAPPRGGIVPRANSRAARAAAGALCVRSLCALFVCAVLLLDVALSSSAQTAVAARHADAARSRALRRLR